MNETYRTEKAPSPIRLVTPTDPWKGVVGQKRIRGFVNRILETVIQSSIPFPHLLVTGPSGGGKSFLSGAIAASLGTELKSFLASRDLCRNDLAYLFSSVQEGTVIHIDEAHAMQPCSFEFFYELLDSKTIPTPGERKPDVTRKLAMPQLTLIFSTNHPGRLPKPLRSRLTTLELDEYSDSDMKELATMHLSREIEEDAIKALVSAAQGNPRLLLQSISHLKLIEPGNSKVSLSAIEELFKFKDVGPKGLTKLQTSYLEFLETQPDRRALVTTLSQHLGIDPTFLRREIEPFIVRNGFVALGNPGRRLSKRGSHFVNEVLRIRSANLKINTTVGC